MICLEKTDQPLIDWVNIDVRQGHLDGQKKSARQVDCMKRLRVGSRCLDVLAGAGLSHAHWRVMTKNA